MLSCTNVVNCKVSHRITPDIAKPLRALLCSGIVARHKARLSASEGYDVGVVHTLEVLLDPKKTDLSLGEKDILDCYYKAVLSHAETLRKLPINIILKFPETPVCIAARYYLSGGDNSDDGGRFNPAIVQDEHGRHRVYARLIGEATRFAARRGERDPREITFGSNILESYCQQVGFCDAVMLDFIRGLISAQVIAAPKPYTEPCHTTP